MPMVSLDIAMASFADNTLNQYNSNLRCWWGFCQENNCDPLRSNFKVLLSFLTKRYNEGASYSTLNSTRSALALLLGSEITSSDCVSRFLKGVFRLRPPRPKYEITWDPNLVTVYLSNFFPYESVSLRDLSLKTIALLALASAQRMQTLSLIKIGNICFREDLIIIKIDNLIKTSRPGTHQPLIRLPYIKENPKICPALALKSYINKTENLRSDRNCDYLFISFKKPHKKVGSQTLGHWVKEVLEASGIDMSMFGAHSTRHAATSAARRAGVSLEVVRRAAGWSQTSNVFLKYYNREVAENDNDDFANALFNQ